MRYKCNESNDQAKSISLAVNGVIDRVAEPA
jgi:hypothetical protein